MRLPWTIVLIGAWFVLPAFAQPQARERSRGAAKLQRQTREGRPGGGPQMQIARIREALELDEQQQEEFDRIAAEFREKRGSGADRGRIRELTEEMRQARQEGDNERAAEIGAELRKAHRGQRIQEFLDEIEGILRDDQREKLAEIRQRIADQRRPGRRGDPSVQLRGLRAELKLTDEQAKRYDELYAELQEEFKQKRPGGEGTEALVEELIRAVEAGDEARIAELKEQLSGPAPRRAAVDRFLKKVERILEPEQVKALDRFRQQMRMGRGQNELENMFRIVRRLDLDDEQRQTLREIQRDAHRGAREARRDPEALTKLSAKVRDELRDMLTNEQVAEFDRLLKSERSDKRGRGQAGQRLRRGGRGRSTGEATP